MIRTDNQHTSAAIGRIGGRFLRSRRLIRLPIGIYRARLGFVFGRRLLMLEHVGRRSGARRYVVLEVVDHPGAGRYVVASGFGRRAQWFRNVEAEPRVRVWVAGRGPTPATARVLTTAEAEAALGSYAKRHPRAWRTMKPIMENTLGAAVAELPMVELRLAPRA